MITQSRDTDLRTEAFQIKLLRNANISERFNLMQALTSSVISFSKEAISKSNPKMSKEELDILFVKLNYGEKLANKLNNYLTSIANEKN